MTTILQLLQSIRDNLDDPVRLESVEVARRYLGHAVDLLAEGRAVDSVVDFAVIPRRPPSPSDLDWWKYPPILKDEMTIASLLPTPLPVVRLPSGEMINFNHVTGINRDTKIEAQDTCMYINFSGGMQWGLKDEKRAALLRFLEESEFYVDLREDAKSATNKDREIMGVDAATWERGVRFVKSHGEELEREIMGCDVEPSEIGEEWLVGRIWHYYNPSLFVSIRHNFLSGDFICLPMDRLCNVLMERATTWMVIPGLMRRETEEAADGAFIEEDTYSNLKSAYRFPHQLPLAVAEALVERLNAEQEEEE